MQRLDLRALGNKDRGPLFFGMKIIIVLMINRNLFYNVIILCFALLSCVTKEADQTVSKSPYYYNELKQNPVYYQPYNAPRSGAYRNPYNQPPRNYYPYYDYDYYYVPPRNYRNVELEHQNGPDTTKY